MFGTVRTWQYFLAAAALPLAIASPASAQQSAEDLIREGMAQRGIYSGYEVQPHVLNAVYVGTQDIGMGLVEPVVRNWDGLRSSWAFAVDPQSGAWSAFAVIQNFSDRAYCIRVKHSFNFMPSTNSFFRKDFNFILEAGRSEPVLTMASNQYAQGLWYKPDFAFWPPNFEAPEGEKCKSVAPPELQAWLDEPASPERARRFAHSRR